jgi:branched-subunit amino acid aminotransferase/4-amino-4-deoxychorismate lyase
LFRLDLHLARLRRSLEIVEIEPALPWPQLAAAATRLAAENHKLLDPADDLGLAIFVTPGPYATLAEGVAGGPLVGMHTYRLPFAHWARAYTHGCSLVTTSVEQVGPDCWPPELKCRSRMHYYLADLAAKKRDPAARALLLDREGRVTETSTANVLAYRAAEGLLSPRTETVLPGISLGFVRELAAQLQIAYVERDLSIDDLATADEVMLTSTPSCILPVTRLNGRAISGGKPGDAARSLLRLWSGAVGIDIAAQAQRAEAH